MAENIKYPITYLYGISKKRGEYFEKLGIKSIPDLLRHYPRGYEYRGNIKRLSDGEDMPASYIATVATPPKSAMLKKNMVATKFIIFDDSARCTVTFFNQAYVKDVFTVGATFRFYGKIKKIGSSITMTSPIYEPYLEEKPLPDYYSVYPLCEGISQNLMRATQKYALMYINANQGVIKENLPLSIRKKYSLCDIHFALQNIHFPTDAKSLLAAQRRLAFEELFSLAFSVCFQKASREKSIAKPLKAVNLDNFWALYPFSPTNAQRRTANEIADDMTKKIPMRRIMTGDVGSGKTACAAAGIFVALGNNKQAAMMAPTEILARQHYESLSKKFEEIGKTTALLLGSTKPSEKKKIYAGLSDGSIDLVIGTHSLLNESVQFKDLALVVCDEQHRFGAMQRARLGEKGENCHILVMSATPIPRTLALVLFGDLDISSVDEMPKGRQKVDTFVVDESYRKRLDNFIIKQADLGGQIYVICPAIEEAEKDIDEANVVSQADIFNENLFSAAKIKTPKKTALEHAQYLKNALPLSVECIHGKMKSAQKDEIMQSFSNKKTRVLVSTTVIEVGVDVPDATLIIIENAEQFGLSQLHQLRGRVGRGNKKSYCVLVMGDTESENAKKRLEIMAKTSSGEEIAQKDLEIRGPGDFLSNTGKIRQSGGINLKLASLIGDTKMLYAAFDEAKAIFENDKELVLPENQPLKEILSSVII